MITDRDITVRATSAGRATAARGIGAADRFGRRRA
jgi:hypothetical protein